MADSGAITTTVVSRRNCSRVREEYYALTEAGERRVEEHFEWMREKVE